MELWIIFSDISSAFQGRHIFDAARCRTCNFDQK